jgi:hypothetical protein
MASPPRLGAGRLAVEKAAVGAVAPGRLAVDAADLEAIQTTQALRQQQAVFEQRQRQDEHLFQLKLVMGWTAYALLVALNVRILCTPGEVGSAATEISTGLVVGQTVCLCLWLWRRVFKRGNGELAPTTEIADPHGPRERQKPRSRERPAKH